MTNNKNLDSEYVIVKNVEVRRSFLYAPSKFPSGIEKYSAVFVFTPSSLTGSLIQNINRLSTPNDTLSCLKSSDDERIGEHFIASSIKQPILDCDHIKDGDLCDVLVQVYRVTNKYYIGVIAEIIYVRKI